MAKTDKDIPKMAICKLPEKEFKLKGVAEFVTEYFKREFEDGYITMSERIVRVNLEKAFEAWERKNE